VWRLVHGDGGRRSGEAAEAARWPGAVGEAAVSSLTFEPSGGGRHHRLDLGRTGQILCWMGSFWAMTFGAMRATSTSLVLLWHGSGGGDPLVLPWLAIHAGVVFRR
jgi:hypothetical protein